MEVLFLAYLSVVVGVLVVVISTDSLSVLEEGLVVLVVVLMELPMEDRQQVDVDHDIWLPVATAGYVDMSPTSLYCAISNVNPCGGFENAE